MKQFKKLASLLLAAVLAMTLLAGCGGRGGNVGTAVTEQSILKYINESRKAMPTFISLAIMAISGQKYSIELM